MSRFLRMSYVVASVAVLISVRERLEREAKRFRHSALSDPLTGIANRRSLLARIDYEITRHSRGRRPDCPHRGHSGRHLWSRR